MGGTSYTAAQQGGPKGTPATCTPARMRTYEKEKRGISRRTHARTAPNTPGRPDKGAAAGCYIAALLCKHQEYISRTKDRYSLGASTPGRAGVYIYIYTYTSNRVPRRWAGRGNRPWACRLRSGQRAWRRPRGPRGAPSRSRATKRPRRSPCRRKRPSPWRGRPPGPPWQYRSHRTRRSSRS